jgi:large-conductance mechanosensitive channel
MPDQPDTSEKLPSAPDLNQQMPRSSLSAELREILEFNERENQKHRDYFLMLYKLTAGAMTALVIFIGALIAFVGWHTVSDIRKQAQDATSEEIRATKEKSQKAMDEEIQNMRKQITGRLDAEFQTPNIREMVGDAARRQTQLAMMPLITNEVKTQVSSGVHAEQGAIQETLVSQTHKALDDMKPVIDQTVASRVGAAVDAAVKTQVDTQITPRIQQLQNSEQISELVTQAESGDGQSFDILARIAGDQSQQAGFRNTAIRTFTAVMMSHNEGIYSQLHFNDNPTPEEKLARLQSNEALQRRAAIDELTPDYVKDHLDQLFGIMTSDPDLGAREAAYQKFKSVTGNNFLNLDNATAISWWTKHRDEFVKPKK